MIKKIAFCVALLISMISLASADNSVASKAKINDFAFDLYRQVGNSDQNIILSPYSLSTLLSKLVFGADGQTREQLLHLFRSNNMDDAKAINAEFNNIDSSLTICHGWADCHLKPMSNYFKSSNSTVEIANAFWADKKFTYKNTFLDKFKDNTFVAFNMVDFAHQPEQARVTINDWVAKKTYDEIRDLLGPGMIENTTRLILINAIYFKGKWLLPFKPNETNHNAIFVVSDDTQGKVDMMHQNNQFDFVEDDKVRMLQLDYKDSPLAMAILLPKSGHTFIEIQKALNAEYFAQLINASKRQEMNVNIPKFDIETLLDDLKKSLMSLGLIDAFGSKANFSMMSPEPLFISKVIQKAIIKVDEQGTVAAAATGVIMGIGSIDVTPSFVANHPFIYIIFDKQSKLVLFIGQFTRPDNAVKCGTSCEKIPSDSDSGAIEGIHPF